MLYRKVKTGSNWFVAGDGGIPCHTVDGQDADVITHLSTLWQGTPPSPAKNYFQIVLIALLICIF